MPPRRFLLRPFPGESVPSGVTIGGMIARRADVLSVRFEVRGDRGNLWIPPWSNAPERKDRLWEDTCFEVFLGTPGSAGYIEYNVSPSGHWNVYRFDGYREGMREEESVSSLPFRLRSGRRGLLLSLDLGTGRIFPPATRLLVGIAAVLRCGGGERSHWALFHPRETPDFHDRNGFALMLPP